MKQIIKIISLCALFIAPSVIGMELAPAAPSKSSKISLVAKSICNRRAALTTLASIAVGVAVYFAAKHHRGLCASIAATVPIVIGMIIQKKIAAKATEALKELLGKGALVEDDWTAIEGLLDRGADINVKNKKGFTALILAAWSNRIEKVQLLLDRGADINIKNKEGATVLNYAFSKPNILKLLQQK